MALKVNLKLIKYINLPGQKKKKTLLMIISNKQIKNACRHFQQ